MYSYEIVLQFPSEVAYALLALNMSEQVITEKERRFSGGHWAAYAGQVMQLPKGASECCFAALVGAGYDKNALAFCKVKVVCYDGRFFREEPIG